MMRLLNTLKTTRDCQKAELLPDYSDIALVVADLGDGRTDVVCPALWRLSEEWKIYYAESKDLTLVKGFINDEMLQSIGIFTITDKVRAELFKLECYDF